MKFIVKWEVKSVSENNFFDFKHTNDALAELSASLQSLETALDEKKESFHKENKKYEQNLKEKDLKLALLRETSEETVTHLDNLINKLDNVLEKNVGSNNNN